MIEWESAWNKHDLDGVMSLFHENIIFQNWQGAKVQGADALRQAWAPWFKHHGGFKFTTVDLFVDEVAQKVLYCWQLDWLSQEKGYEGKPEKRRGVDVIRFEDGKIIDKRAYSHTTIEIDGDRIKLRPSA